MNDTTLRELGVWQNAHACVLASHQITARFPREELFGLSSQLRRAAVSVPANIAEGFVKRGVSDKLRFSIQRHRRHRLLPPLAPGS